MKRHTAIALGYFFIVSLMGLLLRFFYVTSLPINYKYFLHAHSHTALLGWIYLGLTTLIYQLFLKDAHKPKTYRRIFYVTNISIIGMLIAFPIQGYALYSIAFSGLFLLCSYAFSWFSIRYAPTSIKSRFSWKLIKTALFYLVLSSLGTWAIGPIMAVLGKGASLHNNALYFFLHFMSNGWFFLALLGILFYILEKRDIKFDAARLDRFYVYLNIGVFLSFFLSVLWIKPQAVFYLLGGVGAVFQLIAYVILFGLLRPHFIKFKSYFGKFEFFLLRIAGVLLTVKILLQVFSAVPYFAALAFRFRDFIIGFLHLEFLGIVVLSLFVFLRYVGALKLPKNAIKLFLIAFGSTEILIFYHATSMWLKLPRFPDYYQVLAGLSVLFPMAIGWLAVKNYYAVFTQKSSEVPSPKREFKWLRRGQH